LVDILDVKQSDFKREAKKIAETYRDELPSYIESVRKLGDIKFWTMKQKTKIGSGSRWVKNNEIDFADALEKVYHMRIESLSKLQWL
ncbi:MAG: type II toxin-antitoxin system HipA family toxin, partial [Campylobacterota bacterium]|nr:type II toxin-antitoxin system HipA family toxin [Campylobacterota bacterium]